MSNKPIEIELKFWYENDLENKLKEFNALQLKSQDLSDSYYDNANIYFLVLNDCWLRLRKTNNVSKWELKHPSKLCNDEKLKNFDNYFEIEEVDKIIEFVLNLSKNYTLFDGVDRDSIGKFDIESLIKLFDLKEFAKINSHRKSYSIDQIEIDLDETDFGYKVGELEIILDDKSASDEIENATNKISKMVTKLGIKSPENIPGKMSVYLYKYNRDLYDLLRKSFVLKKDVEKALISNLS